MNTVVTVTSFICGCVVTAWLSMASFNMQTLVILELCFNFLLETVVVGRNRGIIVVPPNTDAHFRIFRLVGTALCLIGATCAVVRETILLQVLSHLLAANYLLEALIILVFEENLRLGPAYKDLANKLWVFDDAMLTTALSPSIVLGLCSDALVALTAVPHEDVIILYTLKSSQTIKLLSFIELLVFKWDSLCLQSCYSLVLLSVFYYLNGSLSEKRVFTLASFTLRVTLGHEVAQFFVQHEARHLDALWAVERSVGFWRIPWGNFVFW